MHPIALIAHAASRDQIRAQRVILGQIRREVHLFPLELLSKLFFPWEAKLTQMPSFDEVDLAIFGRLIDFIWVRPLAHMYLLREHCHICLIVP